MRRRQFIALLGGTAAAWSISARAQQPVRRIGVLIGFAGNATTGLGPETLRLFREAMRNAGWVEGKNIVVDYRFSAGNESEIDAAASELVSLKPDLIYVIGLPAAQAVSSKTHTIPVVFTRTGDPVGFGLVASLNHPGGNVTGFTVWDFSIGGKWMQLLLQVAPHLRHVGIIYNPKTAAYAPPLIAAAKDAAGDKVSLTEYQTHDDDGIETAMSSLGKAPDSGLLVIPEPFTVSHIHEIIEQAARFRVPTLVSLTDATKHGALISYAYPFDASIQEPVAYIDRILRGTSPGELPVQAPNKYQLSINLKTAKALGLDISPTLLATADEVIE